MDDRHTQFAQVKNSPSGRVVCIDITNTGQFIAYGDGDVFGGNGVILFDRYTTFKEIVSQTCSDLIVTIADADTNDVYTYSDEMFKIILGINAHMALGRGYQLECLDVVV